MHAEDAAQRVTDLAQRDLCTHRIEDQRQQVLASPGAAIDRLERALRLAVVTRLAQHGEAIGERVTELARMLAGARLTSEAREHAQELLRAGGRGMERTP